MNGNYLLVIAMQNTEKMAPNTNTQNAVFVVAVLDSTRNVQRLMCHLSEVVMPVSLY
jgi:hypothetical protein